MGWTIIHNDGFAWQDSFDMMNSNESVKLLFMIPVLLYKTSTDRISLDQFDQVAFNYHKIDFTSLY